MLDKKERLKRKFIDDQVEVDDGYEEISTHKTNMLKKNEQMYSDDELKPQTMNMMDKIKDMEKRYHDQGANAESEEEDGLKS